jgi:hypothetical protein
MQSHGPKRFYTPSALEVWFGRLDSEWFGPFTSAQLEEGRRIYREGGVRELELTDRDAIVHRRIDKRDEYAVIEWEAGVLSVRSSTTDRDAAHALAVAGLHEIEELVADEIPLLPDGHRRHVESNGNGYGHASNGNGYAEPSSPVRPGLPSRPLVLVFKTRVAGLVFHAFWQEADGKARLPALGPGAHGDGNGHVSSGERTKLIGLAAYARKAHFQYDQESGAYLLDSLIEIPNFLKTVLPAWRRIFTVELDERSANLLKGTRSIEIEAVAEAAPSLPGRGDSAGLNLRWIFRSGERLLTDGEVATLLKRGGQPVILPNLGIVALTPDRWDSYSTWQKNVRETAAGEALPPYLIFSLFNDARLPLCRSSCAPTRGAAWNGCIISARWAATGFWRMKWASAKRCRCSRFSPAGLCPTGPTSSCAPPASCLSGARRSQNSFPISRSTFSRRETISPGGGMP